MTPRRFGHQGNETSVGNGVRENTPRPHTGLSCCMCGGPSPCPTTTNEGPIGGVRLDSACIRENKGGRGTWGGGTRTDGVVRAAAGEGGEEGGGVEGRRRQEVPGGQRRGRRCAGEGRRGRWTSRRSDAERGGGGREGTGPSGGGLGSGTHPNGFTGGGQNWGRSESRSTAGTDGAATPSGRPMRKQSDPVHSRETVKPICNLPPSP